MKMDFAKPLSIILLLPCWIDCQFTKFVEDGAGDSGACIKDEVFTKLAISLVACINVCAKDSTCDAIVYSTTGMVCKGCKASSQASSLPGTTTPSQWTMYMKSATDCDAGWLRFKDTCYWTGISTMSYSDSIVTCERMNSRLVHIETIEESQFLNNNHQNSMAATIAECSFIGATDEMEEGIWRFYGTNTTISFDDFQNGEPNNMANNEHCAAFYKAYTYWVDYRCSSYCLPQCEKAL